MDYQVVIGTGRDTVGSKQAVRAVLTYLLLSVLQVMRIGSKRDSDVLWQLQSGRGSPIPALRVVYDGI